MPVKLPLTPDEQMGLLAKAVQSYSEFAQKFYVKSILARDFATGMPKLDGEADRLENFLVGLETIGHDLVQRFSDGASGNGLSPWKELVWPAYRIRRTLRFDKELIKGESYPDDSLFLEAVDGVIANRQPELRLRLMRVDLKKKSSENLIWDKYLWAEIRRAFLLIVRKGNGFADLELALRIIDELKKQQQFREDELIVHPDDQNVSMYTAQLATRIALLRAVGLYNLARVVEITAFFIMGEPIRIARGRRLSVAGVKGEIDRFIFGAREAFLGSDSYFAVLANKLGMACKKLIDSSVFSLTLPQRVKELLLSLASKNVEKPVLELWYAQKEAINKRLLDPTRTAIVLSLPTSAGKTLLAEMVIAQTWGDKPEAKIIYLAPTRALVTQVSLTLKRDLGRQGLSVRVATPVFELDPVEDEILKESFDVLVTTPEKLNLLIREEHPAVDKISLVVVDEAHNLADKERGAKLELLLAMLRRERPEARFLLMTPFMSNAGDVARWLGDDAGQSIIIDWKPNDRILATIETGRKQKRGEQVRSLQLHTLDTAHSDCPAGVKISIGSVPENVKGSKKRIIIEAVKKFIEANKSGILLLAGSRKDAQKWAEIFAKNIPVNADNSPSIDLVARFLETETGGEHPLSDLLRKRVAFHHAGLSSEARYFVERLVEEKEVLILCATTTLAQGVHFPLSVGLIETFRRRNYKNRRFYMETISPFEFWNIVGRVGRTLEEPLGLIAFPAAKNKHRQEWEEYLRKDSDEVKSVLIEVLEAIERYDRVQFSTSLIKEQLALSDFLQFILHTLAVSDLDYVRQDLEGILRSSFVYSEIKKENPEKADTLINLTRMYLDHLESKKGSALSGFARLVDGTGFSSLSVDTIWSDWFGRGDNEKWLPEQLFPSEERTSDTLIGIIDALSRIPEIKLGTYEYGEFSSERIARIISKWVNGAPLSQIAREEYNGDILDCTRHVYGVITSMIPWGLRAVQKLAFAGKDDVDWDTLSLLPAMVYHGVRTKEAVALRMLNIPRVIAEGLAEQWRQTGKAELSKVGEWLAATTPEQWERALPRGAKINGQEAKKLWEILDGRLSWKQAFD
jgi:replicative superfamily II helicase